MEAPENEMNAINFGELHNLLCLLRCFQRKGAKDTKDRKEVVSYHLLPNSVEKGVLLISWRFFVSFAPLR